MISETGFKPLYFCHRPSQSAYLRINKNACSSLARFIAELNGPVSDNLWDEENFDLITKEWSDVKNLFTFTFVRNPYHRFFSFYKNWITDPPHRRVLDHYRPMGLFEDMPLETCVKKVVKMKKKKLEAHLRPQHEFIFTGNRMNVNFIGNVENSEKDMSYVQNALGIEGSLSHHNKTQQAKELPLGAKSKALLFEYYRKDFELFDYDPEIEVKSSFFKK